jgi:hypothetical protein
MPDVTDLTTRRARLIAAGFMAAYQRQRDAMRLAGVPSSELAPGDDGEVVVADVAACRTVAAALPRAGLSALVLRRMSVVEEGAFAALDRAVRAYWGSEAIRRGLGREAAEPFRLLRAAWPAG